MPLDPTASAVVKVLQIFTFITVFSVKMGINVTILNNSTKMKIVIINLGGNLAVKLKQNSV